MNHTFLSFCLPAAPQWRRRLRQPVGRGHWRRWRRILTLVYCVSAIAVLHNYLILVSAPTAVGILALFYTPTLEKHPPERFRFGWLAFFFIALYFLLPVKTTLYFAWASATCLLLETFHCRIERTVPFILLLLTPVISYFVETFSFPIRLQLTALAGRIIGFAGLPVAVSGNSITFRDHAFAVDPACVGLHMLLVSLLAGLLLMNYYQTHYRKRLPTGAIVALLISATILNIIANGLRIVCLVALAIAPDNPLHDVLGLVFLLGYILLPLLPLIRYAVRRFGTSVPGGGNSITGKGPACGRPTRPHALLLGNLGIAVGVLLIAGLSFRTKTAGPAGLNPGENIPGYKIKEVEGSVLQLDNGRSLVYIKPIPGFYYTDHTPTICWQGSGYPFSALQETVIEGTRVFEGILQKKEQRLYTAWWYDNGVHQTTQPIDWRWDLIRGAPAYSVVNITSANPQDLHSELRHVLKTHPFRSLLGRAATPAKVKIW